MYQNIWIFLWFVLALPTLAQDAPRIQTPFRAPSLSGIVIDQTGSEMPGVLVERLGVDKNSVLDDRVTDAKGTFSFSGITQGNHSLKLTKPGWTTVYVTVVIDKKAKSKLELTIFIAR